MLSQLMIITWFSLSLVLEQIVNTIFALYKIIYAQYFILLLYYYYITTNIHYY